jgi:flagellin
MEMTQNRVSSGYRVETAADNAAYWSIATTMRSDNKAMSTVKDALGLGAAKVDVAYTGMNSAIDVVSEIKAKLVAAREPGVDKTKIDKELTELKNQLVSISESASFSGENWLNNTGTAAAGTKEIVGGFNRDVQRPGLDHHAGGQHHLHHPHRCCQRKPRHSDQGHRCQRAGSERNRYHHAATTS